MIPASDRTRSTPKIASPTSAAVSTIGVRGWLVATTAKITHRIRIVPAVEVEASGTTPTTVSRRRGITRRTIFGGAGRFASEVRTMANAVIVRKYTNACGA